MAGVSCRWHDLRHTFISRCGENGIADQTLLALAGQLSRKVLERYSHARNESKRAAVKMLDIPAREIPTHNFHHSQRMQHRAISCKSFVFMVGAEGFEPPTLCSQTRFSGLLKAVEIELR